MEKEIATLNGKPFYLPSGFHLNQDLVPLFLMKDSLRYPSLSKEAKLRLKWMDLYQKTANASLTCRHFGISRKTFYYWRNRYNPFNLKTLEDKSRAPLKRRLPEITALEEQRIIFLRKKYLRYSKLKLAVIYQRTFREKISSWKIQRTIQKYKLYYLPKREARIQIKRQKAIKKKRITELKKEKRTGFLICLDAVVIYWNSIKRYIFTVIDFYSKISFARMYTTKSSKSAEDFLKRIYYLYQAKIENLQTDNGSEFQGYFQKTVSELPKKIQRYFSRPRTPKDNPVNENFNGVLKREFLDFGNFSSDVNIFNRRLTEWLIEYNFNRPHQALGYQTPIEFHFQHQKVLPMCPSSANY
jgi:transposase InsO family protein